MTVKVDARGLSCPQPVVLVTQAIKDDQLPIEVLVDTVTSRENVRRMAQMKGCKVEVQPQAGDEFRLVLTR